MKTEKTERGMEERILEAAKAVFIAKGFDGASMGGIAAEAGITRTSLNYYFRSKKKLFLAIYTEIARGFLPKVEDVALENRPVFERMEKVVDIYTKMLSENSGLLMFLANESYKNPGRYFDILRSNPEFTASGKRIANEIKREMSKGKLRKMPLEYFVTTFFGLLFFPFLGKNIIAGIFFKADEARFAKFISERKKFIVESMKSIFNPRKK